ncbi:hypothetical protein [Deinococcus sp. KNUC1210]|nr:hypothetical protein [Deinococcus sp. KNUC1210]
MKIISLTLALLVSGALAQTAPAQPASPPPCLLRPPPRPPS